MNSVITFHLFLYSERKQKQKSPDSFLSWFSQRFCLKVSMLCCELLSCVCLHAWPCVSVCFSDGEREVILYLPVTAGKSLCWLRLTHPAQRSLTVVRLTPSEWHLHWHSFTHSRRFSNKPRFWELRPGSTWSPAAVYNVLTGSVMYTRNLGLLNSSQVENIQCVLCVLGYVHHHLDTCYYSAGGCRAIKLSLCRELTLQTVAETAIQWQWWSYKITPVHNTSCTKEQWLSTPGASSIFSARDLKCKCTESLKYSVSYCRGLLILRKFYRSMFGPNMKVTNESFMYLTVRDNGSCEALFRWVCAGWRWLNQADVITHTALFSQDALLGISHVSPFSPIVIVSVDSTLSLRFLLLLRRCHIFLSQLFPLISFFFPFFSSVLHQSTPVFSGRHPLKAGILNSQSHRFCIVKNVMWFIRIFDMQSENPSVNTD